MLKVKNLKVKILLIGPRESGKTVLANFLSDTVETIGGDYSPTQGVRILEFESQNLGNGTKDSACEVELWDCSGDFNPSQTVYFQYYTNITALYMRPILNTGLLLASSRQETGNTISLTLTNHRSYPRMSSGRRVKIFVNHGYRRNVRGIVIPACWSAILKDSSGVVVVFNPDVPSHLTEAETWYSTFISSQSLQAGQCLLIAHHKPGSGADASRPHLAPQLNKLPLIHSNLDEDPEGLRQEFRTYLGNVVQSLSESREREEMSIIA